MSEAVAEATEKPDEGTVVQGTSIGFLVRISPKKNGDFAPGTGVAVAPNLVLTAAHVLKPAYETKRPALVSTFRLDTSGTLKEIPVPLTARAVSFYPGDPNGRPAKGPIDRYLNDFALLRMPVGAVLPDYVRPATFNSPEAADLPYASMVAFPLMNRSRWNIPPRAYAFTNRVDVERGFLFYRSRMGGGCSGCPIFLGAQPGQRHRFAGLHVSGPLRASAHRRFGPSLRADVVDWVEAHYSSLGVA